MIIDSTAIAAMLLEAQRITKQDYTQALGKSRVSGKSVCDILFADGKITTEDLAQALTIHLDIALLKKALDIKTLRTKPFDEASLSDSLERLSLLFKVGNLLNGERDIRSLLELLIREAPMVMNAERATVFLADFDTHELYSHVGTGIERTQIRIPWDSGIAGWVFTNGKPLNIPEPYKDPRFNKDVDCCTGFTTRNILCVSIQNPGQNIIGVFQVINKRAGVFTTTDVDMLTILSSQAAQSIENAWDWDNLRHSVETLTTENLVLKKAMRHNDPLGAILGNSAQIESVRSLIRKVAHTNTTVLIEGESGTGKELVAKALHGLSSRSEGPMINLNCAAVPSELAESELFGHRKGAFTGAVNDHKGVFRAAHEGTIFLDEIEAMPLSMQVKLLRALQQGEIKSVGDESPCKVDVRVIAASNQNIALLVRGGRFREDLYYRLNVFPIQIPPLRDRLEDIPVIVSHLLEKLCLRNNTEIREIDPEALDFLMKYHWPGNVRELENSIERAYLLSYDVGRISSENLPPRIFGNKEPPLPTFSLGQFRSLAQAVEDTERRFIKEILDSCNGNKTEAARILGLSRQGLRNKTYKYGLYQQ